MPRIHHVNRKLIATLLFSLLASIVGIIHGVFFDLDFAQIKRLTLEGFIFTFVILFPTLLLLEWIFDINNKSEFKSLESRVARLERSKRR